MYPQRFIVFIVSCIKPDRSKPENMLVRRGHEVITAQFCTGERRLKKKKNTHYRLFVCPWPGDCSENGKVLLLYNPELFESSLNQRGKPSKSPVIAGISRNTICYPLRVPPLISSHPAAEHPSPSTVTMSNTEARYSSETEWNCTFHQQQVCLPILAPNLLGYPPSVSVWSPRDGGHRAADRERSASTPPPTRVRRRRIWQVITIYITHGNWN